MISFKQLFLGLKKSLWEHDIQLWMAFAERKPVIILTAQKNDIWASTEILIGDSFDEPIFENEDAKEVYNALYLAIKAIEKNID